MGEDTLLGKSRKDQVGEMGKLTSGLDNLNRGRRQTFMGRPRIVKVGGEDKLSWAGLG